MVKSWCDLDVSRWSEGLVLHVGEPVDEDRDEGRDEVPVIGIPLGESPDDRALRYMGMLVSGEVSNRAELARRVGCSRSYITKVLRRLPVAV